MSETRQKGQEEAEAEAEEEEEARVKNCFRQKKNGGGRTLEPIKPISEYVLTGRPPTGPFRSRETSQSR